VANFFDHPFFVIYSDNFSQWDIRKLVDIYQKNHSLATMAIHWREDVTQSGMVEFDQNNRVLNLVEKPQDEDATSHYVSAGFFYMNPKVLNYIPEGEFSDFGYDIFPKMLRAGEKIYAVKMEDPIIGIDTVESYKKADELALKLLSSQTP